MPERTRPGRPRPVDAAGRHRGRRLAIGVSALLMPASLLVAGTAGAAQRAHHHRSHHRSHATTYKPVTNYLAFVGGHKGPAKHSLSPISIGVINQQGGAADIAPEWTLGAELAAKYLNRNIGGINGHPVKLVKCFIADTVSDATQCGQQMANNPRVKAIALGLITVGNNALESAVAPRKKVLVWGISSSPVDETYKYGFALFGDASHVEAPFATFAQKIVHAKSVAIVYENIPGGSLGPTITADALRHVGIKVKVVGYDPNNSDLTAPLEASGASHADLFFNDVNGPACANVYKAVRQLHITTPVVANVPCASDQIKAADGGELPHGWYYGSAIPFYGDKTDPSGPAFLKVARKYGDAKYAADAFVENGFSQVLTIAKWDATLMREHKKISPADVLHLGRTDHNPVPLSAPTLVCGQFRTAPVTCNDKVSFFHNTAPGVFKVVGRWLGPPKGFVIPKGLE